MENRNKKYDLEERTARFGENIIEFAKNISKNHITDSLVKQLIRSATSVGANYCEADCAETKKDFEHKIGISKKESRESKHWLRMIAKAEPTFINECRLLWREANELNLIFTTIVKRSREKN
jgi:four helix bundle protein